MAKYEKLTNFPQHQVGETPLDLWDKLYPSVKTPRHETYISMPITSGPAKTFILETKKELPSHEVVPLVIKSNMNFAENLVSHFAELNGSTYTFPHHLEGRNGWKETDYNAFWMKYISGISPKKARAFNEYSEKKKVVNQEVFNDHFASKDARIGEYQKLFDSFSTFAKKEELNPVSKMVFMPGHDESFGCTLENMLAESLKIPREFIVFDKNHKAFADNVIANAPWISDKYIKERSGDNLLLFEKSA